MVVRLQSRHRISGSGAGNARHGGKERYFQGNEVSGSDKSDIGRADAANGKTRATQQDSMSEGSDKESVHSRPKTPPQGSRASSSKDVSPQSNTESKENPARRRIVDLSERIEKMTTFLLQV